MKGWLLRLVVWPHSTGEGKDKDDKKVAPNKREFSIEAADFNDAVRLAKAIQQGIESQDMVWQAPIVELANKDYR